MILQLLEDKDFVKAWGPIVVGCASTIAVLFGLLITLINFRRANAEALRKAERDEILRRLREFYSPMVALRTESRMMYDFFALQEKDSNSDFRTVDALVAGHFFSKRDTAILEQIIEVGKRQVELIEKNLACLDNPALAELLGRLAAHIRVLSLAYQGEVRGLSELSEIVFPREVDGAVESEILKLQERYESAKLGRPQRHGKSKRADKETVKYYNSNASSYCRFTAWVDLGPIYKPFLDRIPRGGRILDAGCGVGRDTRYLIGKGYKVISMDPSEEMVAMCRQYSFAYCIQMAFDQVRFIEEFDGIWACASLLHVPRNNLPEVFGRLATALRGGGVLYFSLKKGTGSQRTRGRLFEYYTVPEIETIIKAAPNLDLIGVPWENASAMAGDTTMWINFLCQKPSMGTPRAGAPWASRPRPATESEKNPTTG